MIDPSPGSGTGTRLTPTNAPIESSEDGQFRHHGSWNSFQFDPPLTHEDALVLDALAGKLGYRMLFRRTDYSLDEVQAQLVDKGPSSFLDLTSLQEDISPKEPSPAAEQRMADRMRKLAPVNDLIITDPFLFTRSRARDCEAYATSVGKMIAPALAKARHITAVVKPSENDKNVRAAVEAELQARAQGLTISVVESDDFHDRFWIADRARGLVIGTSLNKIGRRIFFVDELNDTDVAAVLAEIDLLLNPQP